jgi:hypothetical protein
MRRSTSGTCSTSTPNCLGPPPIFMPEPLSSKSGLTRTATRAGSPAPARPRQHGSSRGLHVDQHAGGHRLAQLGVALAGAGKADLGRVGAGVQRHLQLAGRGHVDAVDQAGHVAHHGRHRVGLHRVVQLHRRGSAARSWPRAGAAARGRRRRTASGRRARPAGQRLAADQQLAVARRELVHRGMHREGAGRSSGVRSLDPGGGQQLAVDLAVGVARQRAGHLDAGAGTM